MSECPQGKVFVMLGVINLLSSRCARATLFFTFVYTSCSLLLKVKKSLLSPAAISILSCVDVVEYSDAY
ncbi:unnamed protein product [Acanthoscelides obtectus]|uniref:Uncharacterized protein n=1 Tax=Acanthoscelides obtectus TaxID=200917 RepID=A0A9P0VSV6_ACAOB|nr:unnamed protein product [Acanthoscelides obtectus]CAK1689104.1 hypothetical protein AOBTE_LOCUS37012 [Acanthoscelides obtectus]